MNINRIQRRETREYNLMYDIFNELMQPLSPSPAHFSQDPTLATRLKGQRSHPYFIFEWRRRNEKKEKEKMKRKEKKGKEGFPIEDRKEVKKGKNRRKTE